MLLMIVALETHITDPAVALLDIEVKIGDGILSFERVSVGDEVILIIVPKWTGVRLMSFQCCGFILAL